MAEVKKATGAKPKVITETTVFGRQDLWALLSVDVNGTKTSAMQAGQGCIVKYESKHGVATVFVPGAAIGGTKDRPMLVRI